MKEIKQKLLTRDRERKNESSDRYKESKLNGERKKEKRYRDRSRG